MNFFKTLATTLIGKKVSQKVGDRTLGSSMVGAGVGFLVTKVATRSLPGAALVGGGYLAKKLYDKRKADKAREQSASSGLSNEDTDMAMARAGGETDIVTSEMDAAQSDAAFDTSRDAEQLDAILPRPVTG
ncbi:hypothetical protein [Novosphingopyxis baekryungensis]|uniref:hypothetical protein n=1 Tax=Novosphingopyxis baekryungensis TaxID=279369 RepID=UPI0003B4BC9F|nr:hypothetical protein [Novosphingopyxis baekryungensis]